MRKITTILFIFLSLIYSCSEDSETDKSDEPPVIPKIHQHNPAIPDEQWGPDALTEVDGIYIEWDENQEEDLAGYNVYRSVYSDQDFEIIGTVSDDQNYYEDLDVELSKKYYYRVTAFNLEGLESKMSQTVWYTLLPKAQLIEPDNQAILDTKTPKFKWLGIGESNSYILRVFVNESQKNEWKEIWQIEKYDYEPLEAVYNENNQANEELASGKEYRWRVDVEGGSSVGSESNWRRFSIQ